MGSLYLSLPISEYVSCLCALPCALKHPFIKALTAADHDDDVQVTKTTSDNELFRYAAGTEIEIEIEIEMDTK